MNISEKNFPPHEKFSNFWHIDLLDSEKHFFFSQMCNAIVTFVLLLCDNQKEINQNKF